MRTADVLVAIRDTQFAKRHATVSGCFKRPTSIYVFFLVRPVEPSRQVTVSLANVESDLTSVG